MKAAGCSHTGACCIHGRPRLHSRHQRQHRGRRSCQSKAQLQDEAKSGLIARFPNQIRLVPLTAGVLGFVALLINRTVAGVAPIADASSSQSRTDVLIIGLSACLALSGFQWLALKPVVKEAVEPTGKQIEWIDGSQPEASQDELLWAWQSLESTSCCRSAVAIYDGRPVMQAGLAPLSCTPGNATLGEQCKEVMQRGKATYLGNLALFPGREEFTRFVPGDMSCLIIAPIGSDGVLIVGGDTQRGFSQVDQAWITCIADKLDDTLETDAADDMFEKPKRSKRKAKAAR